MSLRRLRSAALAIVTAALSAACGNPDEASCRRGCEQTQLACFLSLNRPEQSTESAVAVLLSCFSAFSVCTDSCDQSTSRL